MRRRQGIVAVVAATGLVAACATATTTQQVRTADVPSMDVESLSEITDDYADVAIFGLVVDDLEDMDVVGPGGEEIGVGDEVLADEQDRPVALAVEVGDYLGIEDGKEAVFPLDRLRLENAGQDDERLVTTLTRAQIEALPEWEE